VILAPTLRDDDALMHGFVGRYGFAGAAVPPEPAPAGQSTGRIAQMALRTAPDIDRATLPMSRTAIAVRTAVTPTMTATYSGVLWPR